MNDRFSANIILSGHVFPNLPIGTKEIEMLTYKHDWMRLWIPVNEAQLALLEFNEQESITGTSAFAPSLVLSLLMKPILEKVIQTDCP